MKFPKILALVLLALDCLFETQLSTAQTLQQSANNRYLQWSDGTPFFIISDTAWLLTYKYSDQEVKDYLDARASQGFNTIQLTCCFPENGYMDVTKIFSSGDLAQPVAAYWTHVDWVVDQITSRGLVSILNPFWKKTSDAWLQANGVDKCRAYGKWFASRYKNNPKVIYFIGGDSKPEPIRDEMDAMGLGVQDAYAGKAIVAYHGTSGVSSREAFPTATWLTLDWIYAYAPPFGKMTPYQETWNSWTKYSDLPMQFGEGFYDFGEATARSRFGTRYMVRRQAWWSTVAGAIGGYAYGAESIWFHNKNNNTGPETWQEALQYESGKDIIRMKNLLGSLSWQRLQPDINHAVLTGGYGTLGAIDFALAAVADDKSFALVYTPVDHTLSLTMPSTGNRYTLRWWDPSSASYKAGSTSASSGETISLASPGKNSAGDADWVLVIAKTGTSSASVANGTYRIVSLESGKALDVFAAGTTNGTKVEQWTYNGGSNQRWTVTSLGADEYSIIGVGSGRALDVVNNSLLDGGNVQIWAYTGTPNQKWKITEATTAGFYKVAVVHSGKVLDVTAASTANGANIEQWQDRGSTNQQWSFLAP